MSTKQIQVTMPDGSVWAVPAEIVARNLASSRDETEVHPYLLNNRGLIDHAQNNMNWSDVIAHATRIQDPPPACFDYQDGWVNGPMEVVEVPEDPRRPQ